MQRQKTVVPREGAQEVDLEDLGRVVMQALNVLDFNGGVLSVHVQREPVMGGSVDERITTFAIVDWRSGIRADAESEPLVPLAAPPTEREERDAAKRLEVAESLAPDGEPAPA